MLLICRRSVERLYISCHFRQSLFSLPAIIVRPWFSLPVTFNTMITTYNTAVTGAASGILGKERRRKRPWVTKDVLALCDERRDLKKKRYEAEGAKEYRAANKTIRKAVKKAKEDWIDAQCEKIETCLNTEQKQQQESIPVGEGCTSEKQDRSSTIQDRSGKCLTEE